MQLLHVMVPATILFCVLNVTFPAPENAADAWREFFSQMEGVEIPQGTQSEWTTVELSQYEDLQPLIIRAKEIAMIPTCDWNLDYSKGLDLLIPHVSDIRQAAMLVSFSIQGDTKSENFDSAIMGMESLVGISSHLSDDDLIIGSLVSYSVFSILKDNTSLFENVQDPAKLESLLDSVQHLNEFDPFGIRAGVAGEQQYLGDWLSEKDVVDLDLGGFINEELDPELNMELEVSRYGEAMDRLVEVFQMKDESKAVAAMDALQDEVESGEFGELTKVLFVSGNNLLKTAFSASKDVVELKSILQQRIDTLRTPDAAAYFLQAVDAYCAIDAEERIAAVKSGEFNTLNLSLSTLAKAAEMQPSKITLADDPQTPPWLAPIFAMTSDSLARGTIDDFVTAIRVAAHLSQQDRFAASLAASMIIEAVFVSLPRITEKESSLLLEATRRIPAADAYMILATTAKEQIRFEKWMFTEEGWSPTPMALLAATITLAKEQKVDGVCEDCWVKLIATFGVPDDDTVVLAAVTQNMSEALLVAEFENEHQFIEKLRHAQNQLPMLRRKLATSPTRQ
jgi:hypothetical protein